MSFIQLLTQYPAFVPSILIGVLLVFWLAAIVGLLDFDSVGPDWIGGHDASDIDGLPETVLALGLDRLPFSIVISAIGLYWWLLTMLAANLLLPLVPLPLWLGGTALLLVTLIAAVFLAAFSLRPLKPLFAVNAPATRESALGKRCRILTLSVEENFGQAEVDMGDGTRLTLQVYASVPNRLARDAQALIIDFDAGRKRYLVAEFDPP